MSIIKEETEGISLLFSRLNTNFSSCIHVRTNARVGHDVNPDCLSRFQIAPSLALLGKQTKNRKIQQFTEKEEGMNPNVLKSHEIKINLYLSNVNC